MTNLSAKVVFFVRDTPRAMAYYTETLGFSVDWTYEEQGRPYVVQVSLLGLQIILNQRESATDERPGSGRIFLGLDEARSGALLQHVQDRRVPFIRTHWGAPTIAIHDLDRNEIYVWVPESEHARWGIGGGT